MPESEIVLCPRLGQGLVDATVITVEIKVGESCEKGALVATVESDKSVHDVASQYAGIVVATHVRVGQRVSVGDPIVTLASGSCERHPLAVPDMTQGYSLRPIAPSDIGPLFAIWSKSQQIASREAQQLEPSECQQQFTEMLQVKAPFGCWVSVDCKGEIDGFAALLPYKNNPTSRELTAEICLYVQAPDSQSNSAVLLLSHLVSVASERGMSFLIGFVGKTNSRAQTLMRSTSFRLLDSLGSNKVQLWVHDFLP